MGRVIGNIRLEIANSISENYGLSAQELEVSELKVIDTMDAFYDAYGVLDSNVPSQKQILSYLYDLSKLGHRSFRLNSPYLNQSYVVVPLPDVDPPGVSRPGTLTGSKNFIFADDGTTSPCPEKVCCYCLDVCTCDVLFDCTNGVACSCSSCTGPSVTDPNLSSFDLLINPKELYYLSLGQIIGVF